METFQPSDESRVLVIYTGGTIGMLVGPQGYRNEPHFLRETLRCQSRFHDPLEDSLYSHSGTIEGFRRWSSSGRSSPSNEMHSPISKEVPTLIVKSTRPIRPSLLSDTRKPDPSRNSHCRRIEENAYECLIPSLITPRTSIHAGNTKRIRYAILEWDPLLDSSNVGTEDWVRIATEIELNYAAFDAFVILHGTDTMAYTSSALSFMLEDLGKTVILTGAQIPLSQLRNDAVDNLLGALSIAGQYIIPECCIFFNQCLYRGNRVSKVSSYDLDAFNSPNFPPLVNVGIDIVVNWDNVIRQTSLRRFKAHKDMSSRVATLRLFPGISAETIRAFLKPPIQGVVLETFGAGNAPQKRDLMEALREASERCVVVAITQCSKGTVSDAYETGRALLDIGIIPGGDMTPECALTKLGYLLSKPQLTIEKVRDLVRLPLRGELTAPRGSSARPSMAQHLDTLQDCLAQMMRLSSSSSPNIPEIVVSSDQQPGRNSDNPTASWSWTAAEASATESSLLHILIRLAVAKDDVEGLEFCLSYQDNKDVAQSRVDKTLGTPAAGVVNSIDPCSGWAPLHVAAFNGSERTVAILLQAGALVHLRDSLGHTALYYAARRGHTGIVEILRQAGANLGGTDIEGGFVALEVTKAAQRYDEVALQTWRKAGYEATGELSKA
ncbi:asparaginase-domain-containing protein [Fomitiporia mediterranea MF3/22]|uniref:asparaginase-domain-containing protein n=1 Tax=Fomitiporia mediterranea (strain MF3/22) TaxID=694068 RepID=UPI000440791D|nr:asparaginase-domain-containing protein [Fomitiporia mediterranea MF3/22]EJD05684.1 asparaginase-domain-containing protein [Fomitiporia mediterranea MF3/22]